MARGPIVHVDGARELRTTLRKAGTDLRDFNEAHRAVSTVVASAGRARAPRRTGRLASSVRPAGTRTQAIARAGNNTTVPYANPIHWGWPKRGIAPALFLTTAAQDTEQEWVSVYEGRLLQIMRKVRGA